jgi:hypothetical protein
MPQSVAERGSNQYIDRRLVAFINMMCSCKILLHFAKVNCNNINRAEFVEELTHTLNMECSSTLDRVWAPLRLSL